MAKDKEFKVYLTTDLGKVPHIAITDTMIGVAETLDKAKKLIEDKTDGLKKELAACKVAKMFTLYVLGYDKDDHYVTLYYRHLANPKYIRDFRN